MPASPWSQILTHRSPNLQTCYANVMILDQYSEWMLLGVFLFFFNHILYLIHIDEKEYYWYNLFDNIIHLNWISDKQPYFMFIGSTCLTYPLLFDFYFQTAMFAGLLLFVIGWVFLQAVLVNWLYFCKFWCITILCHFMW